MKNHIMAMSMKVNAQSARPQRRPSVDSAVMIESVIHQAQRKSLKQFRKNVSGISGGKVAQLFSRRRSQSVVVPEPESDEPLERDSLRLESQQTRPWSRLPSADSVDSSADLQPYWCSKPSEEGVVLSVNSYPSLERQLTSWSQRPSVDSVTSSANSQPVWSRRPSVDSASSGGNSQPVWSRRPSVDSVTSSSNFQSVWSRRPSVDSIASTTDSIPTGRLGFSTVGAVAIAAQKLKRLSQETRDVCGALNGHGECSYCFKDLCQGSIAFLHDQNVPDSQNCRHFLHVDCCSTVLKRARKAEKQATCPKCQCEFGESHVVSMPHPFEDPDGWYQALDVYNLNRVPRERVLEALVAALPIEAIAIKDLVWRKGALRGKLSLAECKEILGKIESQLPKIQRRKPCTPPDIEQAGDWFAHWDKDGVGLLTKEEATRALLKSFPNHDLPLLREAIDLAWQENQFADMLGPEAFDNRTSGIVALMLQKYKAAKYWKIWGSDDCDVKNPLPRCLSCEHSSAF